MSGIHESSAMISVSKICVNGYRIYHQNCFIIKQIMKTTSKLLPLLQMEVLNVSDCLQNLN